MTHFSILVMTSSKPSKSMIDRIMAPFREYDGEDDAFVRDVDVTEEARKAFTTVKTRRLRSPDGKIHGSWGPEHYRDPTPEEMVVIAANPHVGSKDGMVWDTRRWPDGLGRRPKVLEAPVGWYEVELTASEHMSFPEFIEYWHGYSGIRQGETPDYEDAHSSGFYVMDDAGEVLQVFRRYNPQGYWDWYEIGGRFAGELRVFEPSKAVPGADHWSGAAPENGFDICQKGNLDLAAMLETRKRARRDLINQIAERADISLETLERVLHLERQANDLWMELTEPRPRGEAYLEWVRQHFEEHDLMQKVSAAVFDTPRLKEGQTLEEYIADTVPISVHAVVKDGKWHQRGRAGMFASMHEETMSAEEWKEFQTKLIHDLPDGHWITVVDCHV
jgi:hypothetical protein